ncbi:protein-L-isoaspartate O-methyltransferase [Pelagophyceae sp. CCMP2097]|nr:protein-L-isoaspartate O-methyltransferase [Pelagophyceae sp. CCMP2097]
MGWRLLVWALSNLRWSRASSSIEMSNDYLISKLVHDGVVGSKAVERVLRHIDRRTFTTSIDPPFGRASSHEAYRDAPLSIGGGQTISAPHMHARALEFLAPKLDHPNATALDVGSGSGYLTAALALIRSDTKAYGVEIIDELTKVSYENIRTDATLAAELLDGPDARVSFFTGDGARGLASHAPYDAIHVGAAARKVPRALLEQLKPGGRLVIPVGDPGRAQYFTAVDKMEDGTFSAVELFGVRYVPLVTDECE